MSFLEGLVVGDIAGLADGTGSLSVFTNEKGGIIDDTVITKARARGVVLCCLCFQAVQVRVLYVGGAHADGGVCQAATGLVGAARQCQGTPRSPPRPQVTPTEVYLVVNAGCREKDLAHIGAHLAKAKARARAPRARPRRRTSVRRPYLAALPNT